MHNAVVMEILQPHQDLPDDHSRFDIAEMTAFEMNVSEEIAAGIEFLQYISDETISRVNFAAFRYSHVVWTPEHLLNGDDVGLQSLLITPMTH